MRCGREEAIAKSYPDEQKPDTKACFRTPREVDAADVVHSCFFSKGFFRDALILFNSLKHNCI